MVRPSTLAVSAQPEPQTAFLRSPGHYATAIGIMPFNQLHLPFDNPAIRRAVLGAIDQAEAMSAIAGTDRDDPPFEADHWCARRRHQHREHHPTDRLRPTKELPAVDKHDTAVERISETLA